MPTLRDWYPAIQSYISGRLPVDEIHTLYWEECGNPDGIPVVFLHGGPGGGCSASSRRYFDPARFRIVLFDQRGAGRSTPSDDLVQGIETVGQGGGAWLEDQRRFDFVELVVKRIEELAPVGLESSVHTGHRVTPWPAGCGEVRGASQPAARVDID